MEHQPGGLSRGNDFVQSPSTTLEHPIPTAGPGPWVWVGAGQNSQRALKPPWNKGSFQLDQLHGHCESSSTPLRDTAGSELGVQGHGCDPLSTGEGRA